MGGVPGGGEGSSGGGGRAAGRAGGRGGGRKDGGSAGDGDKARRADGGGPLRQKQRQPKQQQQQQQQQQNGGRDGGQGGGGRGKGRGVKGGRGGGRGPGAAGVPAAGRGRSGGRGGGGKKGAAFDEAVAAADRARAQAEEAKRRAQKEAAARAKAEAEALEAARREAEEAAKRAAAERAAAEERYAAAVTAAAVRSEARAANLSPERPSEAFLKTLDSSIKRCTGALKKLSKISEDTEAATLVDLAKVNLSKYVPEAAVAVCDAKLKSTDIMSAARACWLLHRRYEGFGAAVASRLQKIAAGQSDDAADATMARRRSALRLLCELVASGVEPSLSGLVGLVRGLLKPREPWDGEEAAEALALVLAFAKQGQWPFLGLDIPQRPPPPPGAPQAHSTAQSACGAGSVESESGERGDGTHGVSAAPTGAVDDGAADGDGLFGKLVIVREDQRQVLLSALGTFMDGREEVLLNAYRSLRQMEVSAERSAIKAGSADQSKEKREKYLRVREAFDALQSSLGKLAEVLGRSVPALEDAQDDGAAQVQGTVGVVRHTAADISDDRLGPFDDEYERAYYQDLLELRAHVPGALLGEERKGKAPSGGEQDKDGNTIEDVAGEATATSDDGNNDGASTFDKACVRMDAFEETLDSDLSTREDVDKKAVEFCLMSTKASRKRLARRLEAVPRSRPDLAAHYARLVATIAPHYTEVAMHVVDVVQHDFARRRAARGHTTSSVDGMHGIENRLANARYMGELAKFGIVPPSDVLRHMEALLRDLSGQNIDVLCALLESCGRYLLLTPLSAERMAQNLDKLKRLASARNLESRHTSLIESAMLATRPPERAVARVRTLTPLELYVRDLVIGGLGRGKRAVPRIVKQVRRLPWARCGELVEECVLEAVVQRSHSAPAAAVALATLRLYRPELHVGVVDCVLEELRQAVEDNDARLAQRKLALAGLLAELHNVKVVPAPLIFATLNMLLTWGHASAAAAAAAAAAASAANPGVDTTKEAMAVAARAAKHAATSDPPTDWGRARLCLRLLGACGETLDKTRKGRTTVDAFIVRFQQYVLAKARANEEVTAEDGQQQRAPRSSSQAELTASGADADGGAATEDPAEQPLPVDELPFELEFAVQDVFERLRPRLVRFVNLEEATAAAQALDAEEAPRADADVEEVDADDDDNMDLLFAQEAEDGSSDEGESDAEDMSEEEDGSGAEDAEMDGYSSSDGSSSSDGELEEREERGARLRSRPQASAEDVEAFEAEMASFLGKGMLGMADAATASTSSIAGMASGVEGGPTRPTAPAGSQTRGDASDATAPSTMNFRCLIKGKSKTGLLAIPTATSLVAARREAERAQEVERREIRRLVLEADALADEQGSELPTRTFKLAGSGAGGRARSEPKLAPAPKLEMDTVNDLM